MHTLPVVLYTRERSTHSLTYLAVEGSSASMRITPIMEYKREISTALYS